MAIQKRFIHFKKFSDFNSKKLSANEANTQYTIGVSGAIQSGAPDILYQSYCWIKDTQQQWTHGQLYNGKEASGGEENVQSDWNVTDTSSDAYIKNKPTIPSEVTESTVSGWGFTKNTGTYSKPSTGIPKSDLASAVQTSLGKADTALQSYTEKYKGTVTGVKINGTTKNPSSGIVDLGNVITAHQDISGKQDKLTSGTNIKTINGESILGSGNISISGGSGTITGVSANGTSIATSGVANIPAASTSAYGVTKLSSATNSTSTTLAATASAVKAAYDLASGKASMSDVNTAIANAITTTLNTAV